MIECCVDSVKINSFIHMYFLKQENSIRYELRFYYKGWMKNQAYSSLKKEAEISQAAKSPH